MKTTQKINIRFTIKDLLPKPKGNKLTKVIILFSFLLLLFTITKITSFIRIDQSPPHWDYATHINHTIDILLAFKKGGVRSVIPYYSYYPPLIYYIAAIPISVIGVNELIFLFINLICFTILILGTRLFLRSSLSKDDALISSLLILTIIMMRSGQNNLKYWEFMLDIPVTVVILSLYYSVYLFFKNKTPPNLKNSTYMGLLSSAALLIKWTSLIYILVPVVFYSHNLIKTKKWKHFWIFTSILVVLTLPWYLVHFKTLTTDLLQNAFTQGIIEQDSQGISSLIDYIYSLINSISTPVLLLLTAGLIRSFSNKSVINRNQLYYLNLLFLLIPSIFFIFILSNKDPRYVYPILLLAPILLVKYTIPKLKQSERFLYFLILLILVFKNVFTFLPPPEIPTSTLSLTDSYLTKNNIKSVGYFFENDSPTFNFANVELLHKINLFNKTEFSEHFFINNFSGQNIQYSCHFPYDPDVIAVYTSSQNHLIFSPQLSYEKQCSNNFKSKYFLAGEIMKESEWLKLYKHKYSSSGQINNQINN